MIDVKIIKKPKNEGGTSALLTSAAVYSGMAVKEAAHAAKADLAELAKQAEQALHAARADEAAHATEADNTDKWDGKQFADYLDQAVRKTDIVEFGGVVTDELHSAGTFVDGLTGSGFRLWKDEGGQTFLTLDKLTVRQTMSVFELLINKIRSVGGQICVSAANGKIKSVTETGLYYHIVFEQENTFVAGDLMRCQTFTGGDARSYWVEIASCGDDWVRVKKGEFDTVLPKAGDECVLMGNTADTARQNLVLISATDDGQPRVDVMDGVKNKTLDGTLRARLGNLDGIVDGRFPSDRQPQGNGLYADNAYLKGSFVLDTGEDVKTRFEATEGMIYSAVDGVRNDVTEEKGYLNNPSFADGLKKWTTETNAVFLLVGNKWVWANGNVLSAKGEGVSVLVDDGRTVARLNNSYLLQRHADMQYVPLFEADADGQKKALPVYLTFLYRCRTGGTLKVGFDSVDKTGFADFESLTAEAALVETDGYVQYNCEGLWNGTGDFRLEFDGDMYLYMLVLSTDKTVALTYKYKTLFEQSEKLIRLAAQNFDADGNVLQESGIMVKTDMTGLYAIDGDGTLKALVGAGQDGIKLKADNIELEGAVSANKTFRILTDGSMEATGGTIGGLTIGDEYIGMDPDGDDNGMALNQSRIRFKEEDVFAQLGKYFASTGYDILCRLHDLSTTYNTDVSASGKIGIDFDIAKSIKCNLAFAGNGSGALNGFIDGYAFKKITLEKQQYYGIGDACFRDFNRLLIVAKTDGPMLVMPSRSNVKTGIYYAGAFCLRLTLIADYNSFEFSVVGRNTQVFTSGKAEYNTDAYPVFIDENGKVGSSATLGAGDTLELMLIYDPDNTDTYGREAWPMKYTARVINLNT